MNSLAFCALWLFQAHDFEQLKIMFDYDKSKEAAAKLTRIEDRGGGVQLFDFSFDWPRPWPRPRPSSSMAID